MRVARGLDWRRRAVDTRVVLRRPPMLALGLVVFLGAVGSTIATSVSAAMPSICGAAFILRVNLHFARFKAAAVPHIYDPLALFQTSPPGAARREHPFAAHR